ncbi:hypothetical protein C8J56DRAFT_882299 [Mycena floridula]|nr:hypothetical protein C8J56DRAFT_882299 [Mycena floridula]
MAKQSDRQLTARLSQAIPGLIAWLQFIVEYHHGLKLHRRLKGLPLMSTPSLIRLATLIFSHYTSLDVDFVKEMESVPGCIEAVTGLWIEEVHNEDPHKILASSPIWGILTKFLNLDNSAEPEHSAARRLLDSVNMTPEALVELLVLRLRDIPPKDSFNLTLFLTSLTIRVLQIDNSHSFHANCLEGGIAQLVTRNLVGLVSESLETSKCAMMAALGYLDQTLDTGEAVDLIHRSLKAGLLTAFVALSPHFSASWMSQMSSDTIINLLERFTKYMFSRSVLRAAESSIDSIESDDRWAPVLKSLRNGTSAASLVWKELEAAVEERIRWMDHEGFFMEKVKCGNLGCGRVENSANKFKKCSICKVTLFCDKDCLAAAWKSDHKKRCKELQVGLISKKEDLNKYDERRSLDEARQHPEQRTTVWGEFRINKHAVFDIPIYLDEHWILDPNWNGRGSPQDSNWEYIAERKQARLSKLENKLAKEFQKMIVKGVK